MGNSLRWLNEVRLQLISHNTFFTTNQTELPNQEEALKSFQIIRNSNPFDFQEFKTTFTHLHVLVKFLEQASHEEKELIDMRELRIPARLVMEMYKRHLDVILPANITFFHFMREKDIYMHFIAIKFALIVAYRLRKIYSDHSAPPHVLASETSLSDLLRKWLESLIMYRLSAIHLSSDSLDALIKSVYLAMVATMDCIHSGAHFRMLAHASIYMLRVCLESKNASLLEVVLACLELHFKDGTFGVVDQYIPSNLFVDFVGFVELPYPHEIIVLMMIHIIRNSGASTKRPQVSTTLAASCRLRCWSILYSMVASFSVKSETQLASLIAENCADVSQDRLVIYLMSEIASSLQFRDQNGQMYFQNGAYSDRREDYELYHQEARKVLQEIVGREVLGREA